MRIWPAAPLAALILGLASSGLAQLPPGALPAGWTDADIGSPALAGSAFFTNGIWTVSSGGTSIGSASDQFNYAATSLGGDGMLLAQVTGQTGSNAGSQAGVMIRESDAAGAPEASVLVAPGTGITFRYRAVASGFTAQTSVSGVTAPVWLRLARSGNVFTGAYSTDGIHWTQVGAPQTILMNRTALAGLAVCSATNSQINSSTFANVLVVPGPQAGVPANLINPYTGGIPFAGETTWPLPPLNVAARAPTPRMGWNSWFVVGDNPGPSESLIETTADALASNGLAAAGYKYVVIDCTWIANGRGYRDANGNLIVDPTRWPDGMKAVADYVHSKGLLMGGYSDIGVSGYGNPAQIGGFGFYQRDADQFAAWGWDFIKIDDHGPGDFFAAASAIANNSYGRPIVLSLSTPQVDGLAFASRIANSFRVHNDISFTFGAVSWSGIMTEFNAALSDWFAQAPGHWNDPDMLGTGLNGISDTEGRSNFNLWAILGAPLMIGTDVRSSGGAYPPPLSQATLHTLTNAEVIAVDQDPLGASGRPVANNVYAKPLGSFTSGRDAVVLLNNSAQSNSLTVNWAALGLVPGSVAAVRDLWAHQDLGAFTNGYTSPALAPHDSMMLMVSGVFDWNRPRTYEAESGYNTLSGTAYYVAHDPNFSAGAYVTGVGMGAANALEFNQVAAPSNGLYEVDVAYACGANRTAQLSVNGGAPTNVSFPSTGGDTNPTGTVAVYVQLNSGTNTLLFTNATAPAPNFDKITVSQGEPSELRATAGDGVVNLSWTAPAGAASFNIYRGTSSGGEAATPVATGLLSAAFSDTNVTDGQTYFYTVTAVNPALGGESRPSDEAGARPRLATTSFAWATTVLSNNPVAYWRLNETSGVTAVDSAGDHDGSYGSAVSLGVAGPRPPDFLGFELTNTAAEFTNGANSSWITLPALNLNTNTVTFAAWIYPVGIQAPYSGVVFCRSGLTTAGLNFNGAGSDLGYTWNNNSGTWGWNSGLEPPANQWSFVALVIQPAGATLYLINTNGSQSASNSVANPNQSFGGAGTIGTDTYAAAARAFNGAIDEVAVFNRALSSAEIQQLYDAGHELPEVRLALQASGAGWAVAWPQGTLFEATNLEGPWLRADNVVSPHPFDVSPTNGSRFYRVLLQP